MRHIRGAERGRRGRRERRRQTFHGRGGIFDASGRHFYVSVQHDISGFGVIVDIIGWR